MGKESDETNMSEKICGIEECGGAVHARKLCFNHYTQAYRWRKREHVASNLHPLIRDAVEPTKRASCTKCDYERPAVGGGLCSMHYMQAKRAKLKAQPKNVIG